MNEERERARETCQHAHNSKRESFVVEVHITCVLINWCH